MEQAQEVVTALIEVKIQPQKVAGYDRIAQRIYQYENVESLYLLAGSYDLLVSIKANSMKEISAFVYEHLATIDGVSSTVTHFLMKKYKEHGQIFAEHPDQEERISFV